MSFTNKNLHHSSKRSINFLKGATFFFLGMSIVLFMAKAFEVIPVATNNNMLTKKISFTQDGTPSGTETITIDGSGGIIQAKVLSGETVCINGDCQTSRPSGGGTSVWSTSGTVAYYNTGNVGIGTDSPSAKLTVVGTGKFANDLIVDGNVGIGTSNHYYDLDVAGTGRFQFILGNKDLHILGGGGGQNQGGSVYINGGLGDIGFGKIILGNIIDSYVGIGTDSPSAKLTVAGTGKFTNDLIVDGNVGIGTGSPEANLHVVGKGKFTNSVQVGTPESDRCNTTADAGKIVYEILVSQLGAHTPVFKGCMHTSSNVTEIILFTGQSYIP